MAVELPCHRHSDGSKPSIAKVRSARPAMIGNPGQTCLSSNWTSPNEDDLKKTISFSSNEQPEFDLQNVTLENCVCLFAKDNEETKPIVEIKSDHSLKRIDILSEGSLIEVFGENQEYLGTCTSNFVDDWEGLAVFHSEISLPNVNRCELKFLRVKDNKRLWLYNIQLSLAENEEDSNMIFNLEKVDELINTCGKKLPKSALDFKGFFESYIKNVSEKEKPNKLPSEFEIFPPSCSKFEFRSQLFRKNPKFYKHIIEHDLHNKDKNSYITESQELSKFTKDEIVELIKNHIDLQVMKIKDEILKLLDSKLNEFQKENHIKLDQIIQLLTSKTNQ